MKLTLLVQHNIILVAQLNVHGRKPLPIYVFVKKELEKPMIKIMSFDKFAAPGSRVSTVIWPITPAAGRTVVNPGT